MPRIYVPFRMDPDESVRVDELSLTVDCNKSWALRYIFGVGLKSFNLRSMKAAARNDPTSRPRNYEVIEE